MASRRFPLLLMVFLVLSGTLTGFSSARTESVEDPTAAGNNLRTGWDADEPGLSPGQVSTADFGQIFATGVDGQVYAQPIVADGTVVAATENNKVYGLDPAAGTPRWQANLGAPWPAATVNCGDLTPNIGVTATPVYNPETHAVYVTSKVADGQDLQHPHWYLHALDIGTGKELPGFPATIGGTPSNNPGVPFNPMTAMQRPGLLLLDGVVYAGFASHCDYTPYVGYVAGVNARTGKQTTLWSTEGGASDEAGIWQSGGGLVSDGPGRIVLATGNGVAPAPGPGESPPRTLGESAVRLAVNQDGTLTAKSYFSPYDNAKLNQDDFDFGSGGPMAIPPAFGTQAHPRLIVQVGKDGRVYLLDADRLGGTAQAPGGGDAVVGTSGAFGGVWGRPAFFGGDGGYVYLADANGPLRALKYSTAGGTPSLTAVGATTDNFGYTSGSPVVTSSGDAPGSALVWEVYSTGPNGADAQLRAYDPVPVNGVLNLRYSAPIGTAAKFAVPATAGGKVYVGTRDGKVLGFGRPATAPLTARQLDLGSAPVGGTVTATATVTASKPLTVRGVSAPAPFAASLAAPVTLAKGQQLSVPVTFRPGAWGGATGGLAFDTDAGPAAIDLHGRGTQPGLGGNPTALDFGKVRTGSARQLGVNIVNTGTAPETITGVAAPSGAFGVANLPPAGTVLQPGASLPVPVTFRPVAGTKIGVYETSSLRVTSDHGEMTVPLSGVALTGSPHLTLSPVALDFGTVAIGSSKTMTFTATNTGDVPLTITKAKAPEGVFRTDDPLPEGQVIPPGSAIEQKVTFTPVSPKLETSNYLVSSNDGQGAQNVRLSGHGPTP
ncbi:choice-of-anchor D domain-containing protein [Amycolatopsis sp. CA-230715]|uniref:choice-of-anchor D domain-containing protein n=1 Tax=Amycolatopsis sp. CA-230715 TaxID=2745196 RepID=UPI001C01F5A3|nr:choice-of-anchor D domain-containing protein [Amycolatopsis sp. CA-230715]QWF78968.1 hypothetical protein HUW46_02368 [Amycolatopsis sp. CA-230715]